MYKQILLLILGGLLLVNAGCGGSKSSSSSTSSQSVTVSSSIETAINSYFNEYYNSQKPLNYNNYNKMSNVILADNENSQLNEAFRETIVKEKAIFNTGITDYQYKIDYQNCSVSGNTTTVLLKLDLSFQFQEASSVKSGVSGVRYTFTLQNNGSGLVITSIDSNLKEFEAFKALVEEKKNTSVASSEAINQAKLDVIEDMTGMSQNSLLMRGNSSGITTSINTSISSTDISTPNTAINKSVYVSCNKYNYKADDAVAYAVKYATASSRIFYTAGNDCTNFISQCVWAGYIGYSSATESAVNAKTGMIPSIWYAGTGGGATNWENVSSFWSYITAPGKTIGPYAIGYNGPQKEYTGVAVSEIKKGDILQFTGTNSQGVEIGHTVLVTGFTDKVEDYSDVLVSYHSYDNLNNSLENVIKWAKEVSADGKCYMRRIVPQSGCYMKR